MKFRKRAKPGISTEDKSVKKLSSDLNTNLSEIRNELGNSCDLMISKNELNNKDGFEYASLYFSALSDKDAINSLSEELSKRFKAGEKYDVMSSEECLDIFIKSISNFRRTQVGSDFEALIKALLEGHAVILVDGCGRFFSVDIQSVEGRSVEEPTSQSILRGPKEGFTERININIGLIRKRIRNKSLRAEELLLGYVTNTKLMLVYIDGLAQKEIIEEIRRRLSLIDIDCILDSGYIEELIKDDRYSIFPTLLNSEKPDSVCAALLEGRVAVLVDGTPYVLTAPALFNEFLQASEDYYHNFLISSLIRLLRFFAFLFTLLVPSAYVALVTFHQEMIPTPLLISLAAQREGVPFPALIEALLMEMTFEILREAGVRMPRVIGSAISIVGALVLGQAAVEAGIVSAVVVIIVSITAISSFAIPNYSMSNAVRIIRFALMVLAGIFGLYGVFMGVIVLILHLCKIKSIGLPYLTPIAPLIKSGNKDTIIRAPLWKMKNRPVGISANKMPKVSSDNPIKQQRKGEPDF